MKLTRAERWLLANQYRILQHLSDAPVPLYEQAITILANGYESEYDYAAQYIGESTVSVEVSSEVKDVLQMFSEFRWIESRISLSDGRHASLFNFWGFDGNNSHDHLAYASFILERGDFSDLGLATCPNSHSDTIETYRSMVRLWKALPRRGPLMTDADVRTVLDGPIIERLPLP